MIATIVHFVTQQDRFTHINLLLSHYEDAAETHLSIFHVFERVICLLKRELLNHAIHVMSLRKLNRLLRVQRVS